MYICVLYMYMYTYLYVNICTHTHPHTHTVVGAVDNNNVFLLGVGFSHAQRQIVGFRARVDKIANMQALRQRCRKLLCVRGQLRIHVARVGVKLGDL